MAIEVVKRGEPPDPHFYGTCFNCKSELKCLPSDGDYYAGDAREGAFLRVVCPVCKNKVHCYPTKPKTGSYYDR